MTTEPRHTGRRTTRDSEEGVATSVGGAPAEGLGADDLAVLELEGRTFRHLGAKERAIRLRLGWTPTRHFVRLNQLLDEPAALAHAPAVVNRLRARRTSARGPDKWEGR